jgi:hypothetical protein
MPIFSRTSLARDGWGLARLEMDYHTTRVRERFVTAVEGLFWSRYPKLGATVTR